MTRAFYHAGKRLSDPWTGGRDIALHPTLAEATAMTALWTNGPMRRDCLRQLLTRRGFNTCETVMAISELMHAGRVVERDDMLRPAAALYSVPVRMPRHWLADRAPSWPVRFYDWLMAWLG